MVRLRAGLPCTLAFGLLLTACASRQSTTAAEPRESSLATEPAPSNSTVYTPLPGPRYSCGVHDAAEAHEIVQDGAPVLIVRASINSAPVPRPDNQAGVPVADYQVLYGQSTEGPVRTIVVASVADNFLPPGSYLLLLGDEQADGTYFVSDGLRGAFVIQGQRAFEQCPDYDRSGETYLASSGITDIDGLVGLLSQAMIGQTSESPSESGLPGSSTPGTPTASK